MASLYKRILDNVRKESFLSVSNVLTMTVTFSLLGLFVVVIISSQTALRYLQEQAQVTVFFKDDYTEESILNLKSKLESDSRIMRVGYVSKEDAYRLFRELNKDEPILLESISASILPASLEIGSKSLKDLSAVASEMSQVDGVEEVRFFKEVIDKFRFWSNVVYIAGSVLVGVFLVVSYSVVLAGLRATISAKGTEFEIMKLVGASDSYIRAPLVYQGAVFGFISSLLSGFFTFLALVLLGTGGIFYKGYGFGFLPGVFINPYIMASLVWLFLILSGVGLGYLGSHLAVKKYLRY